MVPLSVMPAVVVAPLTPRVPPTVALLVTAAVAIVVPPPAATVRSAPSLAPSTLKAPPVKVLPPLAVKAPARVVVPLAVMLVAAMVPLSVMPAVVVAPLTPNVPATTVLPVPSPSTVNLLVSTAIPPFRLAKPLEVMPVSPSATVPLNTVAKLATVVASPFSVTVSFRSPRIFAASSMPSEFRLAASLVMVWFASLETVTAPAISPERIEASSAPPLTLLSEAKVQLVAVSPSTAFLSAVRL